MANDSKLHRLYNNRRWHKLRWMQLSREPLCVYCKDKGRLTPATVADHKVRHHGDEELFFDLKNLQSLCKTCHDSTKKKLEESGVLQGCSLTGYPDDPNSHWNKSK